jgi:transposase
MSTKRRQHNASFKSEVAIAAIRGDKTIAQLSKEFNISQSRITAWKKRAIEGLSGVFARNNDSGNNKVHEAETEKLYAEIGKLKVERDYLKKNLNY